MPTEKSKWQDWWPKHQIKETGKHNCKIQSITGCPCETSWKNPCSKNPKLPKSREASGQNSPIPRRRLGLKQKSNSLMNIEDTTLTVDFKCSYASYGSSPQSAKELDPADSVSHHRVTTESLPFSGQNLAQFTKASNQKSPKPCPVHFSLLSLPFF